MKKILALLLALTMMFALSTVSYAAGTHALNFGATEYSVAAGEAITIPVYISSADASQIDIVQTEIFVPAGFAVATVPGTIINSGSLNIIDSVDGLGGKTVRVMWDAGYGDFSANTAAFSITLTAPSEAGSYDLKFGYTEILYAEFCEMGEVDIVDATVTVTGGAAATDVVVATPSTAAQDGYTANAFKNGAEVRELTIFAKAENATAAGIEIALDNGAAPTAANWTLAADGIGTDGTFAVSAYEIKADGATADYEVLTTANVWARAYATGANGTVYSAWIKY